MSEPNPSLQEQLAALQEQLVQFKAEVAPFADAIQELNSEEFQLKESYRKQLEAIKERRKELDEKHFQAQLAVNNANYQAQLLQQQIAKQEAEEAAKAKAKAEAEAAAKAETERLEAATKSFNMVSAGAPWREWAKEHQIQAGKKILLDRYVILADPMGLGKTLSSIITTDMAETATKEACLEWPFLGIEKQVFKQETFYWTQKSVNAYQMQEWPFTLDALQGKIPTVDSPVGYLPYDLRNKLRDKEYIRFEPAGLKTEIVDSITRPVGRKILYFCPSPLLRNVMDEWRRWSPHRNVLYIGKMSKAERNFALDFTLPKLDQYVVICNYESWRRDKSLIDKLIKCHFDTVIIDEAHNIKDMTTSAYTGIASIISETKPEYIIPMTGTPILNKPQELFSILTLVNPDEFYNLNDFLVRYCEEYETEDGQFRWRFRPGGLDTLAKKIRTNFLRRTREQAGIELPDKTVIYHELDLDEENYPLQAKARKQMKTYATIIIDEAEGKALQATVYIALLTRLRQIETWPAGIIQKDKVTKEVILQLDVEESQKIDYIIRKDKTSGEWEGLIPNAVEEERLVVFSQFKAPLQELKRRVESMGRKAVVLDGSTPEKLRDEIRKDFDRKVTPKRKDSKWDVLLANYKAAGVGLNLTCATQLITLDEEWNAGKRDQAWDRIHRIGQTDNVTIHVVRTKDTVDTWLASIIEQKEAVVGGFEGAISAADLKGAIENGLI